MTLRLAAALAIALGAGTLLAYLHLLGKGPWASPAARHLRAMKDRVDAPAAYEPMDAAGFRDLPRGRPLAEYAQLERRGVAVEGYVQRMLRATDGDVHLDLAPEYRGPENPYLPYVIAEVTPQWQAGSAAWSYEALFTAFRATAGGVTAWDGGPRRARLGGWLLYDYPHEDDVSPPGAAPPVAAWEIHPVTRIELWDDSLGMFVEYRR